MDLELGPRAGPLLFGSIVNAFFRISMHLRTPLGAAAARCWGAAAATCWGAHAATCWGTDAATCWGTDAAGRVKNFPSVYRRSVTFCARQFQTSPTHRSFSLRQSIALTMPNSFGILPALPNLPTTCPLRRTL